MLVRTSLAAIALIGLSAFTFAAPVPLYRAPKHPDPEQMLKELRGTYEIHDQANEVLFQAQQLRLQQAQLAGNVVIVTSAAQRKIRLDGDKWIFVNTVNGEERDGATYTIKLDTSVKPMTFDLVRSNGTTYRQGIFQTTDEGFRFCYSNATARDSRPRPTEFSAGNGNFMMNLKRLSKP